MLHRTQLLGNKKSQNITRNFFFFLITDVIKELSGCKSADTTESALLLSLFLV